MAFAAAGLNCIAVGPTKLYIYNTATSISAASVVLETEGFCTNNCPGMSAGDVIILAHNTSAALGLIRITAITATTCTYVNYAALS